MAVRGAVQAVNRIGGNAQRGVKSKRDIRAVNVVVNRLGQRNDIDAFLRETIRILRRATSAQTHQTMQLIFVVSLNDGIGHIHQLAAHRHFVRLVSAGAQNCAALGQDARQGFAI